MSQNHLARGIEVINITKCHPNDQKRDEATFTLSAWWKQERSSKDNKMTVDDAHSKLTQNHKQVPKAFHPSDMGPDE